MDFTIVKWILKCEKANSSCLQDWRYVFAAFYPFSHFIESFQHQRTTYLNKFISYWTINFVRIIYKLDNWLSLSLILSLLLLLLFLVLFFFFFTTFIKNKWLNLKLNSLHACLPNVSALDLCLSFNLYQLINLHYF